MTAAESTSERRYHHTSSAYVLPNDAIEQNRLDAQAVAIVEMTGGVPCLAPIRSMTNVTKAVDVGCGTGVATLQIAGIFPSAKVYGLDISLIPEAVRKVAPANIVWAVGNVLDVDHDKPGDDVMSREIFTSGGLDYIFGRAEQSGLSTRAGTDAAPIMKDAGLEIISVQTFEFPFVPSRKTPNSQTMSEYVQAKLVPNYLELLRKMLGPQGITGDELERLTMGSFRDITSEEGLHQKYTVTIARKP
ncbi:hypothetical protein EPUS_03850 [Endocarpon pusillum Z07020]|uniref:Methyltransferase domain-containing protein n=1 Tax=Endocarpon pusillum (strain Z07020 / HMAS-L-300199) TaxID=1263415 RepID=U1HTT8_ENDPU|nr:uncharacterized protein EPUS_03850 [Endocarpon pusillum Z07020]ERF74035.1 hypothetical protein EPUS_03850 [Endocarpon pusillum Z07020]